MSSNCVADSVHQDNMIGDNCSKSDNPDIELEGDDFDDFADFQEASPLVADETSIQTSDDQIISPIANGLNCELIISDNLFPSPSISNSSTINEIASNQSTKSLPSLDNIVNRSFTKAIKDTEDVATEQSITADLFNDKTSQSYKIWENLLNPEESTSCRLNWESSHSFQVFLRSLKIDNKNIDNLFITAFESSSESDEITMSSPVSVTSQSLDNQIVNKISNIEISSQPQNSSSPSTSSSSSITLPTTKSTSTSSSWVSNSNPIESIQVPQVSQKQEPSVVLPKTENTHSSASLSSSSSSSSIKPNIESIESTNQSEENQPSTNNQLSNNLLDVTFFLNNPNFMQPCSSPKASVKVNESEQSVQNNESSTKPLSIISSSSTDPFHNLISHIQDASSMRSSTKSQSSQLTKSTITSTESTNRIFEELPLLSFMRTKLLMFPMRDSIKD